LPIADAEFTQLGAKIIGSTQWLAPADVVTNASRSSRCATTKSSTRNAAHLAAKPNDSHAGTKTWTNGGNGLDGSLPRLKEQPGVKEILHGASPDRTGGTTVIVWETADDAKRDRESDLVREPMSLETALGLASTRERFSVTRHLG